MRLRLLLLPLLSGFSLICLGQNLTDLSAIQQGNEVLVNYHLDAEQGKAYTITLYSSADNFARPLQLVTGDIGNKRVLPGIYKTIKWRVLDELKTFDGDISFEIRAVPAVPLFSNITSSLAKVKRGKEVTISWAGGLPKEQVVIELLNGDQAVPLGTTTANTGSIPFAVPSNMKTGNYKIRLSQAGELIDGNSFMVQSKYPIWMKVVPLVVVGGVVAALSGGGGAGPGPNPTKDDFPDPPNLTN